MRIVINTPSGNIGRRLAEQLLDAGEQVVLMSRSPDKVADLVRRGAALVAGAIDDAAVLERAFAGAGAVFWLTPPALRPDFREWAAATARAAARSGLRRAVVLSSVGAHNGPGTGPVGALLAVEEAFRAALPDVTVLRAGSFMENLLHSLPTMAQAGAIYAPIPADWAAPHVATRDIGDKAAAVLRDRTWSGHRVLGVHGPTDLTQAQVAQVLSEVLGRPIQYVPVPLEQAQAAMRAAGMPDFAVALYSEMYAAIPAGGLDPAEPRTAETTTPTTLQAFAREVIAPAMTRAAA